MSVSSPSTDLAGGEPIAKHPAQRAVLIANAAHAYAAKGKGDGFALSLIFELAVLVNDLALQVETSSQRCTRLRSQAAK